MTSNRKLFSTYKAYNGGNVIFGSNLRGNIIGKGTISNDSLKIDNVEHVDNLGFNLLSIGQICDNKCRVTFSEHDSEITKDGKVIGRGIRKKGLYVMKLGNKPKDQICLATIDDNSTLWHRRLGHVNMCLIQSLASKELVRNLPKLKFDQHFCDACKIGKQAHASHKAKNVVSTTKCLELLHMDLFGPSAVRSYGGNRYTLVIVDDYSRKIEESLNVTFDETPPPSKTSPLVDDDLDEKEAIREIEKKNLENVVADETLEIDEIVNIKEFRNHPLENNVNEALGDESWIVTMQEELNQFIANDVWELVPQPNNMTIIGTKWVFRNKLDKNGIVSRNRARLVAQGYNQQEGIDYDETYAPVARLESIRILLAYACALDFKLFQMDVKSAFLNGFINEEKNNKGEDIFIWEPVSDVITGGTEVSSTRSSIPKDIYSLINHYTEAKYIWENVKMILEGSELTKDDRESQLYDEFEHFRQIKGETIQGYYVRFITEVKLNRGLKESNFDQLYSYLKQHEVHANENRMIMERFIQPTNDPLALVSNALVQQYPTQSSMSPQSSNQPSLVDNYQMDIGSTSTDNLIESLTNTLALLNQSFKAHLPQTNNQLRTSSNARNNATVQDGRVVVQDVRGRYNANNQGRPFQRNNARGNVVAGNAGGQNRDGNVNTGQAKPIMCYNCKGIGHISREYPQPI
ncbi:retrovirus-related pol polyprotein from transposon TNT 1-94 [Tanacetum coccineum]|uniref:Retrovirus-related pol polyprotein from transposon TNT 1-94 n=1 Tax=Tanacetum coccineum TaxID=301880 RepID=A0ABQ5J4Y5_9ASTR